MTRETGSDPSQDQQEQKEQIVDKLEQYLQRIEAGKSDPLIADIVRVQGEYADQRVELTNEQGEEIKQLAIGFIKRLSELDLEELIRKPWLTVSMFNIEMDKSFEIRQKSKNISVPLDAKLEARLYAKLEARAKLVFLAYATQTLGEFQEKFLQEYLANRVRFDNQHLTPQGRDIKYVVHNENGTLEEGEFKYANPAFVKFNEQYRQAWERAQNLHDASIEFIVLARDLDSENDEAHNLRLSYSHEWLNEIGDYFDCGKYRSKTMEPLGGNKSSEPPFYRESFEPGAPYSYSVREVDDQGVVHLDRKRETK